MVRKDRVDIVLVERGMVSSRERARALIMAGKVIVEGKRIAKPGVQINVDAQVHLQEGSSPYVSRGGEKIEGALKTFGIDPKGMIVMDVGASTGGFTDCILQKGAKKVYAVDVGYGQLAWKLQKDPRVVNLERRNIRYLPREEVQEEADLIVIDTSFISVEKFLPRLLGFLKRGGTILSLIKPQFEVGKGEVGKGGVVRDRALHEKVVDRISNFSRGLGLKVLGVTESPLLGPKGNREFFIYLKKENETHGQTEGTGTG
ncbi:MAG: hemolysin [Deltaproteobacteria bacterium]|jgi:23S rRNA (cytidine1920-2'-O)/16S rRNA (cytidine1409-2'-O)-methyltransferase|nr:hemolysin [Deltaproteobacteria bacterium]